MIFQTTLGRQQRRLIIRVAVRPQPSLLPLLLRSLPFAALAIIIIIDYIIVDFNFLQGNEIATRRAYGGRHARHIVYIVRTHARMNIVRKRQRQTDTKLK